LKIKPTTILGWFIPTVILAIALGQSSHGETIATPSGKANASGTMGVCPPFSLRDEKGEAIDPIQGVNDQVPYSPKQTCGAAGCHDYAKITQGYHFTQGAGETATPDQSERIGWASTPGNFGGNWCSPAPLYRYLSHQKNESPATMDMTAFSFLTSGCGACHPGGGSAEFDRDGRRYDLWMADPASGYSPGADNDFDGDYHKARWSETGVMEADCLLCHLPGYDYSQRQKQIGNWSFRWAATAGAGLAKVGGSVKDAQPVSVEYDKQHFKPDGTIELPMARSPRNEACLSCHAQPGWKKRGANFRARTDIHLRAGLRCVDCHPAGRSAPDPRIAGHEVHQIGKGDDPGGLVRNDLDNTMITCVDCHETGRLGAPLARHRGLPPLHLERIACQTCHIPERAVMPIQFQASDVFNKAPRIPSAGKKLWTFYGPDGKYRNHYGYLEMMGYDDKPTEPFRPELALYEGKIYPVNRIHSAWPGIEVDGQTALMQPRMSDIHKMWTAHQSDSAKYPLLANVMDDTGDGVPEVNRAEEIDALIASVAQALADISYPMEGKRVVWVMNDRVYRSGAECRLIEKHDWEASPYANVHKYSHDIYPASAALGARGCSDCHSPESEFFFASVIRYPFDENAQPIKQPQHHNLGISPIAAAVSVWRESFLKPFGIWVIPSVFAVLMLHFTLVGVRNVSEGSRVSDGGTVERFGKLERLLHFAVFISFIGLAITGLSFLIGESTGFGPAARWLHGWLGWLFSLGLIGVFLCWVNDMRFQKGDGTWVRALGGYLWASPRLPAGKFNAGQKVFFWFSLLLGVVLAVTGGLLFFHREGATVNLSLLYAAHDVAAVFLLPLVIAHFYLSIVANPGAANSIFGGRVKKAWVEHHHPNWKGPRPKRPSPTSKQWR